MEESKRQALLKRIQQESLGVALSPERMERIEKARLKYRLDAKGMKKFRNMIANGNIPIGPKADHSKPIKDLRPQPVGVSRLNGRQPYNRDPGNGSFA